MRKRRVLIAGLMLVALAGASAAVVDLTERDERLSVPSATTEGAPAPTSGPAEPESGRSPIRFVLAESYTVGETILVGIENVGTRAYLFELFYQACFFSYFDSSGRRFDIPPGTHCDIRATETIKPGEQKTLFRWRLDECVKDRWGCVNSRPLPPDTYTIRGRFRPKAGGPPARVEATFRIVAA